MPTPLFKLLANSIRLGQPPEAVTAIKALVEVIAHQEGELNELRQRLSLLNSRLMFLEAKTTRMEAVSLQGPAGSSSHGGSDHIVMPQREVHGPVYGGAMHQQQGLSSPQYLPKADPLPSRVERPRSQFPGAFVVDSSSDESQDGDAAGGTLVVSRADIDAVVRQEVEHEAPFPLAMPGGHKPHSENHPAMPFKPVPQLSNPRSQRGESDGEDGPRSVRPDSMRPEPMRPEPMRPEIGRDPGRGSISDPYVPIEDLVADTFSSTAEVAAAQSLQERSPDLRAPEVRTPEARSPELRMSDKVPRRPLLVDEPSFDDVLTSIHKRKP